MWTLKRQCIHQGCVSTLGSSLAILYSLYMMRHSLGSGRTHDTLESEHTPQQQRDTFVVCTGTCAPIYANSNVDG